MRYLEGYARVVTHENGTESWDLGGTEFFFEAWEVMTFGGVQVNCQIKGFAILTLNGLTVIPWSDSRV